MTDKTKVPRLFIQIDPDHQHSDIARWVELNLTNEFVLRVQEMHGLLDPHRLQLVTAGFEAKWCLADGWEVRCAFAEQDTWLDVWPDGFTIRSDVVRACEATVPKVKSYSVAVSYLWGSIDEFFSDFYVDVADDAHDCLETAQGVHHYEPGDPDWEVAFSQDVDSSLLQTGERLLHLHEVVRDRLQG